MIKKSLEMLWGGRSSDGDEEGMEKGSVWAHEVSVAALQQIIAAQIKIRAHGFQAALRPSHERRGHTHMKVTNKAMSRPWDFHYGTEKPPQ